MSSQSVAQAEKNEEENRIMRGVFAEKGALPVRAQFARQGEPELLRA